MQHSLTRSPIAEKSQRHIVRSFIFLRKGKTGAGADLRTHDAMAAEEFYVNAEKVHASSFALGRTCCLTIQFGHACIGADPFGQGQPVIPVGRDKRIVGFGRRHTPCRNRFLSDIGVEEATDLAIHFIFFFCHQLELSNELH